MDSAHWIVKCTYAQIRLISTAVTGVLMISGPQNTSICVDGTTSHGNAAMIPRFSHISFTFHLPMRNQEGRDRNSSTPRPLRVVASTTSTKALKKTEQQERGTKRERVQQIDQEQRLTLYKL